MPQVNKFKCNKCDFEMPSGWGGYIYVIDFSGKRVVCAHPGEGRKVLEITGFSIKEAEQKGLVGKVSYCVCLNCLTQHEVDLDRDEKICEMCGSTQVVSEKQLIGSKCPKCKDGDFEEAPTKIWA
jgi:hypothetical protein